MGFSSGLSKAPPGMRSRSVTVIDGNFFQNVRRQYIPDSEWKNEHLEAFCDLIVPNYHWRFRTYYVDSYPPINYSDPQKSREERDQREEHFKEIERLDRFSAIRGESRYSSKRGYVEFSTLPQGIDPEPFRHHPVSVRRTEQKQVDVLIASLIARIAYGGESKHITLITGDQDFIPAVESAKNAGVIIRLIFHKGGTAKTSEKLYDVVDERKDAGPIFSKLHKLLEG